MGDHSKAINDFTQAIKIEPSPSAFYNRGIAFRILGEYQLSVDDFTNTIGICHDRPMSFPYHDRGISYTYMGEFQNAITDFNKAIELDPGVAQYYLRRGLAYDEVHEYEKELSDYTKAIELQQGLLFVKEAYLQQIF